jgi:ABC-2 type transport system permease protein
MPQREQYLIGAAPVARRSSLVIARLTAARASRSALVWSTVFAVYLAGSALGYASTYKTAAQREQLMSTFGTNAGVNAINGPARQIDTVAGFTAWRSLGILSLVGAAWGLLAGTRLLRGEEESGRWEPLLAGATTRRTAATQALAGLAVGLVALWALPAAVTVAVGRLGDVRFTVSAALFNAVAAVASAAVFLAVGALASQVAPTRRRAAAYGGAVLGTAYALRMVADSSAGFEWIRWTTPLGWVEELRPLTSSRPLALLPILGLTAMLGALSVYLAGVRDLGGSVAPDRDTARPRTRLLTGPTGLTVRLATPTVLGWVVAVGLSSLIMGLIAKSAGDAMSKSKSFTDMLTKLGAHGAGASAYLGVAFLIVALLVALIAAGLISATREEEAEGRVEHLLVRPVSRSTWLLGRFAAAVAALVLAALVAAVCAWGTAASQDSGVGLTRLLDAGMNMLPPALVLLGVGVLTLGLWPRAAAPLTYAVLAWSFLLEIVGGVIQTNHWLLDTSLFHHMATAPAADPNWPTNLAMVAIGSAAALAGLITFNRRDMTGA